MAKTEILFSAPTGSNCTFHFPLFKKLIFQLFKTRGLAKTEFLFSAPTGSNCTFHFPLFKKLIFQLFKTRGLAKMEKFIKVRKGVKSAILGKIHLKIF